MRSFIFNIVALVALVMATGCSVEGSTGGGDDVGLGGVNASLTWTGPDGTPGDGVFSFIGTVVLTCADSAYCGTTSVASTTDESDTMVTFPGLPLGPYTVSLPGAPMMPMPPSGAPTIPGINVGDPPPPFTPYTTYGGDRDDFLGCTFTGYSPSPVRALAGTSNTAIIAFRCYFADGTTYDVASEGDIVVVSTFTSSTSCGTTLEDCSLTGRVCATLNGMDPACYAPCVLSDPMAMGGAIPPLLPAAVPCAGTCTLVDCTPSEPLCPAPPMGIAPGSGYWGVTLDRGLCVPPAP